jgi:hypothetical protein
VHEVPAPWHADAPCVCQRTLALAVAIAFAPWDILFSRIFIANVQITEMPLHRVLRTCVPRQRAYSTPASKPRSGHADFYASLLPAMIPVALLGSAVYMGLHLAQSRLAHEKFLDEAREHIRVLEEEVDSLQRQRSPAVPVISTSDQVPSSKRNAWWS